MAIAVAPIRLSMSLLACASSSTLLLSSWLTVVSSSLIDCSSSRLVSSSSVAERSSSFIACNSSLLAFSSSVEASYCSTVSRRRVFRRSSSRSSWRARGSADTGPGLADAAWPAAPGSLGLSMTTNRFSPISLAGATRIDTSTSLPSSATGPTSTCVEDRVCAVWYSAARNSTRRLGWMALSRLRLGSPPVNCRQPRGAGRQVQDVVLGIHQDRRRRQRLQQLEMQLAPGHAAALAAASGRPPPSRDRTRVPRTTGADGVRSGLSSASARGPRPTGTGSATGATVATRRCGASCPAP